MRTRGQRKISVWLCFCCLCSSWAILCLKCLEYVTWGIACLHNKVCIGGAPHFALGDYSKYNACFDSISCASVLEECSCIS